MLYQLINFWERLDALLVFYLEISIFISALQSNPPSLHSFLGICTNKLITVICSVNSYVLWRLQYVGEYNLQMLINKTFCMHFGVIHVKYEDITFKAP